MEASDVAVERDGPPPILQLFEPLLDRLRDRDFPIGIDDYLRLEVLLDRLPPDVLSTARQGDAEAAARLRSLLRPLFATNPEQQTTFDPLFDAFWKELGDRAKTGAATPAVLPDISDEAGEMARWLEKLAMERVEEIRLQAEQLQREQKQRRRRQMLQASAAVAFLVLVAGGLLGAMWRNRAAYEWKRPTGRDIVSESPPGQKLPENHLDVVLRRRDGKPFLPTGRGAPRVQLNATGASKDLFRLILPTSSRPRPELTYTILFAPATYGEYAAHLIVQPSGTFDSAPQDLTLQGHAKQSPPTSQPSEQYRITPIDTTTFQTDTNTYSVSSKFKLTRENVKTGRAVRFQSNRPPTITGPDAPSFRVEPASWRTTEDTSHPFTVLFAPLQRNTSQTDFTALLQYDSQEQDIASAEPVSLTGHVVRQNMTQTVTITAGESPPPPGPVTRRPLRWPWALGVTTLFLAACGMLLRWLLRPPHPRDSDLKPPYDCPLQTEISDTPFLGTRAERVVTLLATNRSPEEETPSREWDMDATVRVAADRAGYISPVLPVEKEPARYLVLAQSQNARDQRGAYFLVLLEALQNRRIRLEVYTFQTDPGFCWDIERQCSRSLSWIRSHYPDHRLLVFADGQDFILPFDDSPGEVACLLSTWSDVALFVPDPVVTTGSSQAILRAFPVQPRHRFGIYPATLAGLRIYAASSISGERQVGGGLEPEQPPIPLTTPPDLEKSGVDGHLIELRERYFAHDRRLFYWLCACALYPRLAYDLTVLIGLKVQDILSNAAAGPLVTEENLLRLFRLEWFWRGDTTDALRLALERALKQEAPEVEGPVRALLIDLLTQTSQYPPHSVAKERLALERRVQEWMLSQEDHAAQLRSQLVHTPPEIMASHPLLRALLARKDLDLWADQPPIIGWWNRLRYDRGIPRRDQQRANLPVLGLGLLSGLLLAALLTTPLLPSRISALRGAIKLASDPTAVTFPMGTEMHVVRIRLLWKPDISSPSDDRLHLTASYRGAQYEAEVTRTGKRENTVEVPVGRNLVDQEDLEIPVAVTRIDAKGKTIDSVTPARIPVQLDTTPVRVSIVPARKAVSVAAGQTTTPVRFDVQNSASPVPLRANFKLKKDPNEKGLFSLQPYPSPSGPGYCTVTYTADATARSGENHKAQIELTANGRVLASAEVAVQITGAPSRDLEIIPGTVDFGTLRATLNAASSPSINRTVRVRLKKGERITGVNFTTTATNRYFAEDTASRSTRTLPDGRTETTLHLRFTVPENPGLISLVTTQRTNVLLMTFSGGIAPTSVPVRGQLIVPPAPPAVRLTTVRAQYEATGGYMLTLGLNRDNVAARARLQQQDAYNVDLRAGFADQTTLTEPLRIVGNPALQSGNREVLLHVARPDRMRFPPPQGTLSVVVTLKNYLKIPNVTVISQSQAMARLNIAYSPDRSLFLATSGIQLDLFDAKAGTRLANWRFSGGGQMEQPFFTPDDRYVVAFAYVRRGGTPGVAVDWWATNPRRPVASRTASDSSPSAAFRTQRVAVSQDGKYVEIYARDSRRLLGRWEIDTGRAAMPGTSGGGATSGGKGAPLLKVTVRAVDAMGNDMSGYEIWYQTRLANPRSPWKKESTVPVVLYIPPGQYTFAAWKDGRRFATQIFSIRNEQTVTLRVSDPGNSPTQAPVQDPIEVLRVVVKALVRVTGSYGSQQDTASIRALMANTNGPNEIDAVNNLTLGSFSKTVDVSVLWKELRGEIPRLKGDPPATWQAGRTLREVVADILARTASVGAD